jgi:hypothetical protein
VLTLFPLGLLGPAAEAAFCVPVFFVMRAIVSGSVSTTTNASTSCSLYKGPYVTVHCRNDQGPFGPMKAGTWPAWDRGVQQHERYKQKQWLLCRGWGPWGLAVYVSPVTCLAKQLAHAWYEL